MPNLVPQRDETLPSLLVQQARDAMLTGQASIIFEPKNIIKIACSTHLRARLVYILKNEINDPELKKLILGYVQDIIESLDYSTSNSELFIDFIDRAGFPVATGALGAGIALLVTTGVLLGPVAMVGGGLFGLASCGAGRSAIKLQGNRNKFATGKLKRLLDEAK